MIGVFDSGVGGLSVWKELHALMPEEGYVYFSDSAFCPYGPKPAEAVRARVALITDFLISKGAGMVVVA
jgi:Glutamate racemase